jgi:5-methylcytosine-specific restriction endonuclease McrA
LAKQTLQAIRRDATMSNQIFVLDTNHKPLTPCTAGMARSLLNSGKAAVFRQFPFTIILKKEVQANPEPIEIKIDAGSKTTGFALVKGEKVIFGAELSHRGQAIKNSLESRRSLRHGRRNRKTRYRQARFLNRTRPNGWLAPSHEHRVLTIMTWVRKFIRFAPIGSIISELVRFDLQQIENPEISGIEYQQGELQGYEVREYLLEKWDRKCAYCGTENVPLQVEHIHPKSKGGSNRISNLTLACEPCNTKKGVQSITDFLAKKPDVLKKVTAQAKRPLKDAAVVNSTRWALFKALKTTGLPVTTGSGGQTKFNRSRLNLPKTHWLAAACVGQVDGLQVLTNKPLLIKATGHGTRQMCRTDKYGFPSRHVPRCKFVKGFQTGDIVKAIVTTGKKIGEYVGRVAVRSTGSFNISASTLIQGISHKYCRTIHRKDAYSYGF